MQPFCNDSEHAHFSYRMLMAAAKSNAAHEFYFQCALSFHIEKPFAFTAIKYLFVRMVCIIEKKIKK